LHGSKGQAFAPDRPCFENKNSLILAHLALLGLKTHTNLLSYKIKLLSFRLNKYIKVLQYLYNQRSTIKKNQLL